jgi:hypothetical protein
MKKFILYFFGAVGTYLVLANATGFGTDIAATDKAATDFTATLQGR